MNLWYNHRIVIDELEYTWSGFMNKCLPGTTLSIGENEFDSPFSKIKPMFALGGLTLSQVRELTGLESSTIQNWVKRGWVSAPIEKKYYERHVSRIIIINMLRGALKLEKIAELMQYINGEVESADDDCISDGELYDILCSIVLQLEQMNDYSDETIWRLITQQLKDYRGPFEDSSERMAMTLSIMVRAYIATLFRTKAETLLDNIL